MQTAKCRYTRCKQALFSISAGACVDLQYCLTASDEECTLRVHRLAAKVRDKAQGANKVISKTQTKKKALGIGQFYRLTGNSR